MRKTILHMDLDTFFVSCERLLDNRLNNRPVLIGGTSDRGVVAACSYEARVYGIHSAMPMKMARLLCPGAVVIRGDSGTYSKFSDMVTEIVKERAPVFEKSSIDEFYVDITGMDRFVQTSYLWSRELREKILKETNLPISFGLSTSKTVSKVGTGEAKPNNHIEIPEGNEMPFLAPLSIKKIPMVGDKTYHKLRSMGVEKIRTVQEMPMELMERVLGKNGTVIWKKAQGIDNTPVVAWNERKSISSERTFEKDTTDVTKLRSLLVAMAENLCYQLRNGNKLTACVTVKIRYSDFQTYTKQKRIPYTSLDHTLIAVVLDLFEKMYERRVLIRLIGVCFSYLVGGTYQIRLFEDSEKLIKLYQAMDLVRNRYGQSAVKRAIGMGSTTIGGMNPFNGKTPIIPAH
ncbi:DNA polymerase IV [Labilibaculum sp. A4]|uniref:DNA polymerase IV n=1 Tax=Labilibaculum euxinus TaxID=2686357 RepID=A0A425Y8V5_9BACT|nr:DNA polymerase IV [Labilibaculum euxinus]MDQ1770174.1 DNA polymerase IV [Labilibaculum euxinus]MUP38977.1 DNA polymerase IV [Labilibaculum euxinus]MVB08182.1 DNA polymerase IV [Labilibaculum euxinus]MWN77612.1 DNA polymerase IV [Labilibaculum euxinus]